MKFEDFYKVKSNARRYERERFSSAGGRMVDRVERDVVASFLKGVGHESRILDLGCGTGRFTAEIVRLGYRKTVGVDISDSMLTEARRNVPKTTFIRSSMFSLPEIGTFDACVSMRVMHHLRYADMRKAFMQVRKVLREGGIFIFDTNNSLAPNAVTKLANLSGRYSYNQFSDDGTVKSLLDSCGFSVQRTEKRFFLPPFVLNKGGRLSASAAGFGSLLERNLPWLCASTFWRASSNP